MNETLLEELQTKLARALTLVSEVQAEAHRQMGYSSTRRASHRAVQAVTQVSEALDWDWKQDELELEHDIK